MQLLELNMKTLYEGNGQEDAWGWNPKKKRKELTDTKAKFVVAHLEDTVQSQSSSDGKYNEQSAQL